MMTCAVDRGLGYPMAWTSIQDIGYIIGFLAQGLSFLYRKEFRRKNRNKYLEKWRQQEQEKEGGRESEKRGTEREAEREREHCDTLIQCHLSTHTMS